jgi:hypothetical protein
VPRHVARLAGPSIARRRDAPAFLLRAALPRPYVCC